MAIVPSEMNIISCIRCDKDLASAIPLDKPEYFNQPYAGTAFSSYGHYGSTVFDPMNVPEKIEIVICDDCLTERSKDQQVLLVKEGEPVTFWKVD